MRNRHSFRVALFAAIVTVGRGVADAQSFDPNAFYRFRNASTGQYLHMETPQLAAGNISQGWWSAMWALESVGGNVWRIRNRWRGVYIRSEGRVLATSFAAPGQTDASWAVELTDSTGVVITNSLTGNSLEIRDGAPAAAAGRPGTAASYWFIEPESKPITEIAKGYYLTAAHSLKCLDVRASSTALVQNDCQEGKPSQLWIERLLTGPWALYVNNSTGQCIEATAGSQRGALLAMAACNPAKKEQWLFAHTTETGDKASIKTHGGLCLDVAGWSQSSDAQLHQWDCAAQANQTFTRRQTPVTVASAVANSALEQLDRSPLDILGVAEDDPEICWKKTSTRGVGKIPTSCPAGYPDYDGALVCYQSCQPGYTGAAWVCWQNCPAGFRDIGVSCAKPAPYGRGGGYAYWWPVEGRSAALARCRNATGGECEMYGELAYPKCAAGYYAFGCCVCSPLCPGGMRDDGAFCAKNTHTRLSSSTTCPPGQIKDAGLCYPECPSGSTGVGPVCWGSCSGTYSTGCGAACAKSVSACTFSIINQVQSAADVALNVTSLVATAGAAAPALQAARLTAKALGKRVLNSQTRSTLKTQAENAIRASIQANKTLKRIGNVQAKLETAADISDAAELLVQAYEQGEFDWTALVPTTVADFDPTGILSLVGAFNKPICK